MLLLPFIMEHQDIESPINFNSFSEKKEFTRKLNFYDYIYLMNDNELLKYKVELDHMDVVNVLEKYIDNKKSFDNVILSEKEAKESGVPLKFLYYLGKYRLEDKFIKTKNYLAPRQTLFLNVITEKYKDNIVGSKDLYNLSKVMFETIIEEDDDTKKLISDLFINADVELIEKLELDEKGFNSTINNIRILLNNNRQCQDVLSKLRCILDNSKLNKDYIISLGLQSKFSSAIKKEKQKVK